MKLNKYFKPLASEESEEWVNEKGKIVAQHVTEQDMAKVPPRVNTNT